MKVYILASLDNISFAEKLLSNIRNASIGVQGVQTR